MLKAFFFNQKYLALTMNFVGAFIMCSKKKNQP